LPLFAGSGCSSTPGARPGPGPPLGGGLVLAGAVTDTPEECTPAVDERLATVRLMGETSPPPSLSAGSVEAESLLSVLERNRRAFAWKTSGLDEQGLRATTAASAMTLGGLIKHLALVETDWLAVKLAGQEYGAPWDVVDFDALNHLAPSS
jgi:hypothetical protein